MFPARAQFQRSIASWKSDRVLNVLENLQTLTLIKIAVDLWCNLHISLTLSLGAIIHRRSRRRRD